MRSRVRGTLVGEPHSYHGASMVMGLVPVASGQCVSHCEPFLVGAHIAQPKMVPMRDS